MNPLRIELTNVRTFQSLGLDLPEGCLAVTGANGAGKSTLVNAIDVALFGPESRSLADWLTEDLIDGTLMVMLVFSHGINEYRIRRTFSAKGRGQTRVDFEEGDGGEAEDGRWLPSSEWRPLTRESGAETQAEIERIIGLSRETFRASSFLAQGQGGVFCEAAPRERKRILAEVLQLGVWETWQERARTEKRACELTLAEIQGVLERAEAELALQGATESERYQAQIRHDQAQIALTEAAAALTTARDSLAETRRRVEARSGLERALRDAEKAHDEQRKRIGSFEDSLRALDGRLEARHALDLLAVGLPALEAERDSLQAQIAQWEERQLLAGEHERLTGEYEAAKARVGELYGKATIVIEGIGVKTCDRCGQTLHEEAARRAAASFNAEAESVSFRANVISEQELVSLNERISALPAEKPVDLTSVLAAKIEQAQTARQQLAALDEAHASRDRLHNEILQMRAGLREREQAAGTARAELDALGPHDPGVLEQAKMDLSLAERAESNARIDIAALEKQIARLDEKVERLAKIAAEASTARDRRDSLHTEHEILAGLERACGPNGVPAMLLENVAIPQIEVEATRILGLLGGPAQAVELRTQRAKKTEAGLRDTLDIVLLTETGERDYMTFSGGERARVSFALRLALAQLLANRKGSQTGLLVIDELEGLDAQGIAALVEILQGLEERIPRIMVVSHHPELRDSFEQALTVEKVDGRSRVVGQMVDDPTMERTPA